MSGQPVRRAAFVVVVGFVVAGCVEREPVVVQAPPPPPPPQAEVAVAQPAPGYVWVPGHWAWRRRAGYVWVPGQWATRGRGYVWIDGHWR